MSKGVCLGLAAVALLFALPAAAAPEPPLAVAPAPAASVVNACALSSPLFDVAAPAPAETPALPDWLTSAAAGPKPVPFRYYCACGCSRIPDCNTDADCSNNRCLKAITCC